MNIVFMAIIAIVIILLLWLIAVYNGLVRAKIRIEEAWSDIDVQLKRRYDLIPNLVETVKGYAKHESQIFENVAKARNAAISAQSVAQHAEAENMLSGALRTLFAVAEAYPELKASENFGKLQDELSDTENKIQAARRFYNSNVRDYNIKLEVFPTNVIGTTFGFTKKEFFEVEDDEQRNNVQVKF